MFYGIKAYQVGKGKPPQTEHIRNTKPYTATKRKDEDFLPFFDGKHIGHYSLLWQNNNWLKYGPWLAEPRNPVKFEGEKLLIRKIIGKTLIATYVPETSYCNTLLYVLKLEPRVDLGYKYLLGILNSHFVGWYFRKRFQISASDTFPQIMIGDILQIPLPMTDSNTQKTLISLVDQILSTKKKDPNTDTSALEKQIDEMVYALYGLTPEEIVIVEGKG
jgi:restriction endonuclease S subunit